MQTRVHSTIDLTAGGNGTQHTVAGWSIPEPHHTWTVGQSSCLILDRPRAPFGYLVEFDWRPASNPPFQTVQTFMLEVNGRLAATGAVDTQEVVAFLCPPLANHETRLMITLYHPGAFAPDPASGNRDTRELALCVRRVRVLTLTAPWMRNPPGSYHTDVVTAQTGPGMVAAAEGITRVPFKDMLHGFDSIAGNCDMGLALRGLEFEQMSLLRFAGATVPVAIKGLETDFDGLGRELSLSVANNPLKEWMVADRFGLYFHSGVSSASIAPDAMLSKMGPYLGFLRRKLLADLDEGRKVFVYADHKNHYARRGMEHILPLYAALKRRSPQARLLWVCPATMDTGLRGSVRTIFEDLAIGLLDVIAPPLLAGGGITVAGWLTVLCNAWNAFGMKVEPTPA